MLQFSCLLCLRISWSVAITQLSRGWGYREIIGKVNFKGERAKPIVQFPKLLQESRLCWEILKSKTLEWVFCRPYVLDFLLFSQRCSCSIHWIVFVTDIRFFTFWLQYQYFKFVCYLLCLEHQIIYSVYGLLQNFVSGNKIEALLWISRLMTVFSTFSYFLPLLG